MPQNIVIKEVKTSKELNEFVQFPKKLYKNCPYFVPPLDSSELKTLTRHPALEFCTQKSWLAYQGGQVVGRIAGIINHKCNAVHQQRRIRFGWFDFINDLNVATELVSEVEKWAILNQLTEICGPSRYSNMEKQALLVEGFDHTPSIGADYNYSYYPKIIEQLGFKKEVDYVQYRVKVSEVPEKINRFVQLLTDKYQIRIRKFKSKRELKAAGREFFKVINESYLEIYNFIPLTDQEIDWVIDENFAVANPELISVLEDSEGRMVGISFCLPSLNRAFQKANGKLFPFGWFHILRALKHNRAVDMYLTGVIPEYAHTGIHAIYHKQLNEIFLSKGYKWAFTSQQLENNTAGRIWTKYDSEVYFRRRCYQKEIPIE